MPVEGLGHQPELDDEVSGQVLRFDLAPLFLPQAEQGGFVVAHDDAGVRSAYERAAVFVGLCPHTRIHDFLDGQKWRLLISMIL
jgi:hypothetical protein